MKNINFIFLSVLFILIFSGCNQKENHVKKLHKEAVTLDSHVDTPLRLVNGKYNFAERHNAFITRSKIDLPRMLEGQLDAVFMAAYVSQGPLTDSGFVKAENRALKLISKIKETIEENPDKLMFAFSSGDLMKGVKQNKTAVYIGIENGHVLGDKIENLYRFYDLGSRYVTLCHVKNNLICDSSNDENGPMHNGLSDYGRELVSEMNKIGMMIDVSHMSDKSFYDVIELSKTPVIASHSCARAVCDNPRNMTDDMIKKLAENGGVIQVCLYEEYVKKGSKNKERDSARKALRKKYASWNSLSEEKREEFSKEWYDLDSRFVKSGATVSDLVDHIDHIVRIAGIDHVGIGSDFDGGGGLQDCYDVSQLINITAELVERGYSDEEVKKIWSGNFMRVFKSVEDYSNNFRENI